MDNKMYKIVDSIKMSFFKSIYIFNGYKCWFLKKKSDLVYNKIYTLIFFNNFLKLGGVHFGPLSAFFLK